MFQVQKVTFRLKNALIEAKEIGYPVLIKAASGGGGRGMKVAMSEKELESAFTSAKSEAKAALVMIVFIWKDIFKNQDILKFKLLEINLVIPSIL